MSVVNYVTGNVIKPNTSRSHRIANMLKKNKKFTSVVKPTMTNRFFNLFSNQQPIPVGTLKKTVMKAGTMKNYNKRALSFLSERSRSVASSNLKVLQSKRNKSTLTKALNKTRRRK
jgi:hypothetical protein